MTDPGRSVRSSRATADFPIPKAPLISTNIVIVTVAERRAARRGTWAISSGRDASTTRHGEDGGSVKFTVAVRMTGVGAPFSSVGS